MDEEESTSKKKKFDQLYPVELDNYSRQVLHLQIKDLFTFCKNSKLKPDITNFLKKNLQIIK
jgi:hypothetical protein